MTSTTKTSRTFRKPKITNHLFLPLIMTIPVVKFFNTRSCTRILSTFMASFSKNFYCKLPILPTLISLINHQVPMNFSKLSLCKEVDKTLYLTCRIAFRSDATNHAQKVLDHFPFVFCSTSDRISRVENTDLLQIIILSHLFTLLRTIFLFLNITINF